MAQHKMVIVDGVRYRPEDVPEGAKGTEDRERVSTNPLAGQAQVIDTSKTRRGRRGAAKAEAETRTEAEAAADASDGKE